MPHHFFVFVSTVEPELLVSSSAQRPGKTNNQFTTLSGH